MKRPDNYFVHESSYIDKGAVIGPGTKIWHFSHIVGSARIGERCNIGQNVYVGEHVHIGNRVKIQNNVSVYSGVAIEDEVFLGPSVVFTNVILPRSAIDRKHEFKTTLVKHGASIGANATILCGVTLGEYCLIGAGAVVTKDVPAHALVYGTSAQLRGWVCRCGERLEFNPLGGDAGCTCANCGKHYVKQDDHIRVAP